MGITTTFDSKLFIEFIEQMMEFILQKSIFVADNVAIHKTTKVAKYFDKNKLLIITIPPYSLWMNPAENLILEIKEKNWKQHKTGKPVSLLMINKIVFGIYSCRRKI